VATRGVRTKQVYYAMPRCARQSVSGLRGTRGMLSGSHSRLLRPVSRRSLGARGWWRGGPGARKPSLAEPGWADPEGGVEAVEVDDRQVRGDLYELLLAEVLLHLVEQVVGEAEPRCLTRPQSPAGRAKGNRLPARGQARPNIKGGLDDRAIGSVANHSRGPGGAGAAQGRHGDRPLRARRDDRSREMRSSRGWRGSANPCRCVWAKAGTRAVLLDPAARRSLLRGIRSGREF
jgi:hypothetical protein